MLAAVNLACVPRYLSSDRDPLYEFQRCKANLRILEVTEVKTVPYVPLWHPFVERLAGPIRQEFLDLVPFWSAHDLQRKLKEFQDFYNRDRIHRGLGGQPPESSSPKARNVARLDDYRWKSSCRGFYQLRIVA